VTKRKAALPVQLKIGLNGNRRLAENVILEVQAAARRVGVEIANVEVFTEHPIALKARKPASRRKPRARA
jgi:hypothetical protein